MAEASYSERLEKEADNLFQEAENAKNAQKQAEEEAFKEIQDAEAAEIPEEHSAIEQQPPVDKAEKRIKDAQDRMHAATRENADLRRQLETVLGQVEFLQRQVAARDEALKAAQETKPSPDISVDQTLEKDWPEVAGELKKRDAIILELRQNLQALQQQTGGIKGRVDQVQQDSLQDRVQKARTVITEIHPDADEFVDTPEFQQWIRQHPYGTVYLQDIGNITRNPVGVIKILTEAKQELKQQPREQDERLRAAREAATPPGRGKARSPDLANTSRGPSFTRDQIRKMSDAEFKKHEKEIDTAFAEGRIY